MCFTFGRMNRQPAVSLFGNLIGKMRNTLKQRNTKESKIQIIILILIQGPCLHTNLNVCSKKLQETVRTNHKPYFFLESFNFAFLHLIVIDDLAIIDCEFIWSKGEELERE